MKHIAVSSIMFCGLIFAGCSKTVYTGESPVVVETLRGPHFFDSAQTIEVRNLGTSFNTSGVDYAPFVRADGLTLYFTKPNSGTNQDLFVVTRTSVDSAWTTIRELSSRINSNLHEGAITFSANDSVVVFVSCNRPDGRGDCDLYTVIGSLSGKHRVANLWNFNTAWWETGPSLSADGRTLYFVSNRPGALGAEDDIDIYVSRMLEDGTWSEPENLGAPINTRYREDSPFLAGDSLLFFASAVPGGIGGLDIYVARLGSDGKWGAPVNLGRPINSTRDERCFSTTADGRFCYFSSDRKDMRSYGGYDIYEVRLAR